MLSNSSYLINNSEITLEVLKGNFHKDLGRDYHNIKNFDHIITHSLLWVDRYLHINNSKDLLLVNSFDFLNDKQKIARQICDFFEIEYIPVGDEFNAKLSGLNHNNNPISLVDKELFKYQHKKTKPGNPLLILNAVNQIRKQYPNIPEQMLLNS
jgi:hypothetical protein